MSTGEAADAARTTVLAARRHATEEWTRLLGAASACTLAKDGKPHPAAKFHEGAVAALGDLARRLGEETDPAGAADAAAEIGAAWAGKVMPAGPRAGDWDAYRAGGIQALTDVAAALAPARHRHPVRPAAGDT